MARSSTSSAIRFRVTGPTWKDRKSLVGRFDNIGRTSQRLASREMTAFPQGLRLLLSMVVCLN